MKLGVIRGEAIRLLRNSTSKANWLTALNTVFKGLMARGYLPIWIAREWKKIRFEDREDYLGERIPLDQTALAVDRIRIRDPTQSAFERGENGIISLVRTVFPQRAVKPYTKFGKAAKVQFHPNLQWKWKQMLLKFKISDVFVSNMGGTNTNARLAILKRWPPSMIFVEFNTIRQSLIWAKQEWPGTFAVERAKRNRLRLANENSKKSEKRKMNFGVAKSEIHFTGLILIAFYILTFLPFLFFTTRVVLTSNGSTGPLNRQDGSRP